MDPLTYFSYFFLDLYIDSDSYTDDPLDFFLLEDFFLAFRETEIIESSYFISPESSSSIETSY